MNSQSSTGVSHIPPAIAFEPYLPKPGETLKVHVLLVPRQIQGPTSLTITLEELEFGASLIIEHSILTVETVDSFTVSFDLPLNLSPGFYRLHVSDAKGEQVASEELVIIDAAIEESFQFSESALQAVIQSVSRDSERESEAAATLLERAAMNYERAGSLECAGLTLADSAFAWSRLGQKDKATALAWQATKLLILAEDSIGATPLVAWLIDSSHSLADVVAQYIQMGSLLVKECESNSESDIKKKIILEIAKNAFPEGEGFRFNLDALIDAMSKSGANIYLPGLDKLISLATSEKAIYSPGVVMSTPRGIAVRCATFIDEFVDDYVDDFQESNQSLEVAVARARAANGY